MSDQLLYNVFIGYLPANCQWPCATKCHVQLPLTTGSVLRTRHKLWTARPLASRTVCRVNVLAPSKFNLHCPSGPAAKQGALGNTSSSNLQRDSTIRCTAMRPSIVRRMSFFWTSAVSRSGTRSFSLQVFLTCFALDFVLAAAFDVCFFLVFWGPVLRVTAPSLQNAKRSTAFNIQQLWTHGILRPRPAPEDLFFIVFHCFSLFFIVFHCFSLFFIVFHCFSLFFIVFHCFSLFFIVFHCVLRFAVDDLAMS